jgi:hypothetical protein
MPGLIAFALSQVMSFVTLRRSGAGVAEALTMTGVQCLVLAGFTDQGFVSGVRSDDSYFLPRRPLSLWQYLCPQC